MILIKTLIFTVLVPGTVTIVIPAWLLSSRSGPTPLELGVVRYSGVLPILLGAAMYAWCAWDFTFAGKGTPAPIDPPKELVVRGLYRYVRNPMYVGILSILIGEALFFQSGVLFEYAIIVFISFHLFVVLFEEPILKRKFGDSYQRYRQAVPRWLPWKIRA
jgi:protein-S-isoprenylcysteine O-methyltransferase Ste14